MEKSIRRYTRRSGCRVSGCGLVRGGSVGSRDISLRMSCARECGSFVRCARVRRAAAGRGGSRATAAPRPPSLVRNPRPRATSNHIFIEHYSNSGNISHHFASHAAAALTEVMGTRNRKQCATPRILII